MENSFYSNEELVNLGFKKIGDNCLISRFARFYGIRTIELGNHVRIDDFCILSGNISIGSYIHISAYCALFGSNGISIDDYSGMSPNSIIYSASDDFSGNYMINPMIPNEFTNVTGGLVEIDRYVQLGGNTVVLPNVRIEEGAVTGFFTMVNKNLEPWKIYVGIPAKILKDRRKSLLKYINRF